jgi:hypothetical protein
MSTQCTTHSLTHRLFQQSHAIIFVIEAERACPTRPSSECRVQCQHVGVRVAVLLSVNQWVCVLINVWYTHICRGELGSGYFTEYNSESQVNDHNHASSGENVLVSGMCACACMCVCVCIS